MPGTNFGNGVQMARGGATDLWRIVQHPVEQISEMTESTTSAWMKLVPGSATQWSQRTPKIQQFLVIEMY